MEKYTCPVCHGNGVLVTLEEQDLSVGTNPNREPDFQDVVVDESLCPHCDSYGEADTPFLMCQNCHWICPSSEMIVGPDDDGVMCCFCPECDDFIKEC